MKKGHFLAATSAALLLAFPESASAYVGPGAGLTVLGAALAFVMSLVLGVMGFVWYPIKRFRRAIAERREGASASDT